MKKQTFHITFVRTRESFVYELPLHYTANVRATSLAEARRKATNTMRLDLLEGKKTLADYVDYYRIVPVQADRVRIQRFIDTVPLEQIDYIRASTYRYDRRVKISPVTSGTLRKLLSGKDGKVTRFCTSGRSGVSVQEAKCDPKTGAVTYVTHDLIVRGGGAS